MIGYDYGVVLGPLQRENLAVYRDWRNHINIRRWCRQKGLIDEQKHEAWFARQSDDPTIEMFEIWDAKEKNLVGVCGLTDIDHFNQRAEFSLYIGPEWHGHKLGKMALQTLVHFGFYEMGLNMIWGETIGDNPAQKVFEDVGFKQTGHRPAMYYKEGSWQTSYLWCLLRGKWRQLSSAP
jgi:RimJ/RimL family protein N-acetyltransferase